MSGVVTPFPTGHASNERAILHFEAKLKSIYEARDIHRKAIAERERWIAAGEDEAAQIGLALVALRGGCP